MDRLRVDALNLITRRLRSQGLAGAARRYWRKRSYIKQGLPVYIMIEPASVCNLRCPYCSVIQTSEKIPAGVMELADYQRLIDSLVSRPGYFPPVELFYRGEPLMNRHFAEMAAYARQKGLSAGTSTNAVLLKGDRAEAILEAGLDYLIVSFDGACKESYEKHRVGAVFEEVVENVTRFCSLRRQKGLKKPFVDLQFIVTKENEHEIPAILDLAKRMGADHVSLKSMRVPLMDRPLEEALELGRSLLPDNPKFRRYREVVEDGRLTGYELIHRTATCAWGHASAIRFNGDVALCCQDYGQTVNVGNVFEQDFWDVWWSESYVKLRDRIYHRRPAICRTCD